ncbi:hypothetical protein B0H10DRAFT_2160888 [Mycena sp. CBHHK59/15]|nr:hypothetical protein B0H10DRAFT_2160888 [Mycena sp. CBHHK59/15]
MTLRIIQLEDELATPPPAKCAKTVASASATTSTSTAAPTASLSKAEEKKRKMQVKKIFDRCKECKSDGVKFQGSTKTIKFDEVLEQAEFETLFGGKGRLIQPTPQNKPKSAVTIIEFNTAAHLQNLFRDELKPLKGIYGARAMSAPFLSLCVFRPFGGGFSKSVKHGICDVSIHSAEISYSKNNLKCTLKFEISQVGGRGDSDSDSDW